MRKIQLTLTMLCVASACRTTPVRRSGLLDVATQTGDRVANFEVEKVESAVVVHYQSSYLAPEQLMTIAPEVLNSVDSNTGQTVADLLSMDKNGIPSLSHTWIEAVRIINYTWNGEPLEYRESIVISWLPYKAFIDPESPSQPGTNYGLSETEAYMDAAARLPVAELAIVARHIRTDGPGKGWDKAIAEHPVLSRPILGVIPRRIAGNKIDDTVAGMAATVDTINQSPRLIIDRGQLTPVAVSEDAFLAAKARSWQLDAGIAYSMFSNNQKVSLSKREGATNCSGAATDLLAGGTSDAGPVPFPEFGVNRGLSASTNAAAHYGKYGRSYKLNADVAKRYSSDAYSISSRLKHPERAGACSCTKTMGNSGPQCEITLGSGKQFTIGVTCDESCIKQGFSVPLIAANCATIEIK